MAEEERGEDRGGVTGGKIVRHLDWENRREKYNVANLNNKGQSIVYLWFFCRV